MTCMDMFKAKNVEGPPARASETARVPRSTTEYRAVPANTEQYRAVPSHTSKGQKGSGALSGMHGHVQDQ